MALSWRAAAAAPLLYLSSYGQLFFFLSDRYRAVATTILYDQLESSFNRSIFPNDFVFGAGTAAYEIEGSIYGDCKGISNYDVFTHEHPERISDGSNGDIAIDSYHRYKEDVKFLKDMGMDAYRFSISWSRILPNGSLSGGICKDGIRYYNDLIDYLVINGLQPFATLLHGDYPQTFIVKYQGYLSKEFIKDFGDFADVCFREFGNRVKHWFTINEPELFTEISYSIGFMPPSRCSSCHGNCTAGDSCREPYIAGHNLLLAHAAVVHLYRVKHQVSQKGEIGITLFGSWSKPHSDSKPDCEAASRAKDFSLGWFLEPITTGDYPFIMRALVGDRLPRFSQEESNLVKGSYDFIGINYYLTAYIESVSFLNSVQCCSYESDSYTSIKGGGMSPQGLEELLVYIKENYNNPVIYITENGIGEKNEAHAPLEEVLQDNERIEFHKDHLFFLHEAIAKGANVKGYFVWSLLDSFGWRFGYTRRFGIIYVDYEDDLKRYPKKSFSWFQAFLLQISKGAQTAI